MSGGSWDYFYGRLDEVATRLLTQKQPNRRALGRQLALAAKALHDIEWVDSSDCVDGDEDAAIEAALGKNAKCFILLEVVEDAQRVSKELLALIEKARQ